MRETSTVFCPRDGLVNCSLSVLPLPEQTCVSAQQQPQTELRHSRQSDSACNGPPPRLTDPVGICPAPGGNIQDKRSLWHLLKKNDTTVELVMKSSALVTLFLLFHFILDTKLTFFTVLSGSSAISGMLASTIRENRFRIRLEYLT